jgi:hypothetical protein
VDESTRGGGGDGPALAATLRRLKRSGARLLVTGAAGGAVRARQTRRLLGSTDERRARVLALADESSPSAFLPDPLDATDERVAVVEHGDGVRSAAAASAEPLPPRPEADALAAFHAAVIDAIADDRHANGPYDPATLRVGVVGAGSLVDRYGLDRTERALRSLGDRVVDRRGMYHCHLAGRPDGPTATRLAPSFDARIDLRHRDGLPPEQRWSFPGSGESTGWTLL